MSYEKSKFENKVKKRKIEELIVDRMKEERVSGSYVGLPGPTLKTHYENWSRLVPSCRDFISYDIDKTVTQQQRVDLKDMDVDNVKIYKRDIFQCYKQAPNNIAILDMDLCETLKSSFIKYIDLVDKLFQKEKFNWAVGFTLTYTLRKDNMQAYLAPSLMSLLNTIYTKYGYVKGSYNEKHYRDTNGAPMCTMYWTVKKRNTKNDK